MRRPFAALAEIVGGADQALAEVVLPDPIDHDAGRQRMVGARQPVGQLPPAAPLGDPRRVLARQDAREAARHGLAGLLVVAAQEDLGVLEALVTRALGAAVLHDDGLGDLRRGLLLQRVQLAAHGRPAATGPRRGASLLRSSAENQNGPRAESSSSYKLGERVARGTRSGRRLRTRRRCSSASTCWRSASSSGRS